MRSRPQDKADPAFLDEKTARKQAERQVVLDALNDRFDTETIEWPTDSAVTPLQNEAEKGLQK